jgi:hypothetical protein
MIEKETRIKEDCPQKNGKGLTRIFAIVAGILTSFILLQNLILPMVHQATTSETSAIAAKVEVNTNRITALEATMTDVKESLKRIENKVDLARIAADRTTALLAAPLATAPAKR